MKTEVKRTKKAKLEIEIDDKLKLSPKDMGGEQFKILEELISELTKKFHYVTMTQKQGMLLANYLMLSLYKGHALTYEDMNDWEIQLFSALLEVRDHIYSDYNIETDELDDSEEVIRLDVLRRYLRDAKLRYLNWEYKGRHVTAEYRAGRLDNQLAHCLLDSNSEYEIIVKEHNDDSKRVELEIMNIKENTYITIDMSAHSLRSIGRYFTDLEKIIQLP
ncbi:hypothetical protein L2095_07870 [Bacillus zanthoxyli]|nr:hypothetical protein [Bacillus zanthoxyli]